MAWLQNLAGRAEDLLNKIDQNAATVLNESTSGDIETQDINDGIEANFKNKGSEEVLTVLRSSSFKIPALESSIHETVNYGPSDMGITFDVTTEKQNPSNSSVVNEDKSIDKSSVNSDQMSTTSSVQNSFILDEESKFLHEKLAKLEFENQDLIKKLRNMQHLYLEIRNENGNLQLQVERSNEQVTQAQVEKDQYIARAQRILQEKERLISLKQENTSTEETQNIFASYNEELKRQLEFHQERNMELTQKNNQLMKEMQLLQTQYHIIQNSLQLSNENLEQNLANEKKFRYTAEEDCLQKTKELHAKNQELYQLNELLETKSNELEHLKNILKQKNKTSVSEDVDSRIKSLIQTLMLKQSKLETVTTERNALRLQIEKLESEYEKNLSQLKRAQLKVVNIQEPDDTSLIPRFMRVSPFDAGVTRRVKHAYSTLDATSIRTGIFLRRYPVARVFVFCYIVLLHIWVLIILFLYAPVNR